MDNRKLFLLRNAVVAMAVTAALTTSCSEDETVTDKYQTVYISAIEGDTYTVSGNIRLMGEGKSSTKKIILQEGADVVLNNVVLTAPSDGSNITVGGNATITIEGTNTITGAAAEGVCPIAVMGVTLTIDGTDNDKLTLTGGDNDIAGALGICGERAGVIIRGGNITANSHPNSFAAAIGSLPEGTCGDITITGGTVSATGGKRSAGIGSGYFSTCGNINISGGTITSAKGTSGTGIGKGGTST